MGDAFVNGMLLSSEAGARWGKMAEENQLITVIGEIVEDLATNQPRDLGEGFSQTVWQQVIDSAERHNDPGDFTALIGYEWTSTPDGDNMHRAVIFRDGGTETSQTQPFSSFDNQSPEDLLRSCQKNFA